MNNDAYGGFMISKNVLEGMPIKYTYREKSSIPQCNGWTILSPYDDDEYVRNPENFMIVSASTIVTHSPLLLEIFDCPYGTDLMWLYNKGVHVGFYDLILEREVTLKDLIKRKEDFIMNNIDFLPLGSVVILKGGIQKLLIISRGINVNRNEEVLYFDYGGVLYPEGLTGDQMAYFNHDGIESIIFEGYNDDDSKKLAENIKRYLLENPNIKRGNPDVINK